MCMYTINTGRYEGDNINLSSPICKKMGLDPLYFTDNWKIVYKCIQLDITPFYFSTKNSDAKLLQRTIKTSPHAYIPHQYDISLYIDGNVYFIPSEKNIVSIKKYLTRAIDLICFKHPNRRSVEEEGHIVLLNNLETKQHIDQIKLRYAKDNFKDDQGLTETNVLIRKHKNLIKFSSEWVDCINICRRDQISFDYLVWKHKIKATKLTYKEKISLFDKTHHINTKNRYVK